MNRARKRDLHRIEIDLDIDPQPDDASCGPTCLHALYRYYGDDIDLERTIDEVEQLEEGGTLAVMLAVHALRRGYRATMYTYNLTVFDPTWLVEPIDADVLVARLESQRAVKDDPKLRFATQGYSEFLRLGGRIRYRDLTADLLRRHVKAGVPVLAGLSATYLYGCARELGDEYDDVRGSPTGHFVVLCGYDPKERKMALADPLRDNPRAEGHYYEVELDRLVAAIFLGIVTYDANLLVIEPDPARAAPGARTSGVGPRQ